jgi:hypothetical protein
LLFGDIFGVDCLALYSNFVVSRHPRHWRSEAELGEIPETVNIAAKTGWASSKVMVDRAMNA